LTAVYDNILEDLVFPAEIVGKRIRVKLDGSQLIKVHLDKNQQTTIEHKVSSLSCDSIDHVLVLLVDNPFQWFNERQAGHTVILSDYRHFQEFNNLLKILQKHFRYIN
jgi:hypothetical protein